MRLFSGASLIATILLAIAGIAFCINAKRSTQVEPKQLSDIERSGQAFRENLLTQWGQRPPQLFIDMTDLCRETFKGKSLQEANSIMRAAGQIVDLTIIRQPAVLTPRGTTPYAGGLGLHSSFISGASFNIIFYISQNDTSNELIVKDVSCGIKEVSL